MKVIYCGQFTDSSGYGSAARSYLKAVDSVINKNLSLKIHNVAFEGSSKISVDQNDLIKKYSFSSYQELDDYTKDNDHIVIWHLPAPSLLVHKQRHKKIFPITEKIIRSAKRLINLAAWEYNTIPLEWKKVYKEYNFDSIIVPSQWNYDIFSEACPNMDCHLVPHVIEDNSKEAQCCLLYTSDAAAIYSV